MLELLALYKFQKLFADGLRLRTACDLAADNVRTTAPSGWALPAIEALEAALPAAIRECGDLFAVPPVTRVRFGHTEASAKRASINNIYKSS